MKNFIIGLMLFCSGSTVAQTLSKGLHIPEVTIYGKRPMKEIGVQKTRLDSTVLKESIALSMADVLTFNSSIFKELRKSYTLNCLISRNITFAHTS